MARVFEYEKVVCSFEKFLETKIHVAQGQNVYMIAQYVNEFSNFQLIATKNIEKFTLRAMEILREKTSLTKEEVNLSWRGIQTSVKHLEDVSKFISNEMTDISNKSIGFKMSYGRFREIEEKTRYLKKGIKQLNQYSSIMSERDLFDAVFAQVDEEMCLKNIVFPLDSSGKELNLVSFRSKKLKI